MRSALSIFLILTLMPAAAMAAGGKKRQKPATPPSAVSAPEQEKAEPQPAKVQRSGAVPGEPDTDGCGLGWQVTDKKTIAASITRGTTNGVVPPSFGMTSGTLGCSQHPFTKRDEAGVVYALTNFDALRIDMAAGEGETLAAFARTMGCGDFGAFGRMTQEKYGEILGGKPSAIKMFLNVKEQIRRDATLSSGCSA